MEAPRRKLNTLYIVKHKYKSAVKVVSKAGQTCTYYTYICEDIYTYKIKMFVCLCVCGTLGDIMWKM